MSNKVQNRLISDPIEVGEVGSFQFRMHTPYEHVAVLVRQRQILAEATGDADIDQRDAGSGATMWAYMLARLETCIEEAPMGFDIDKLNYLEITTIHEALSEWEVTFRRGVQSETEDVGEGGRIQE